jgi:hypothetical protein
MDKISYTGQEEADFIEEDERSEEIKKQTDPKEILKTQEELMSKYDEPEKDTSSEPKESEEETEDKPGSSKDKTETEDPPEKDESDKPDDEQFVLTEDFIKAQPEENREILNKYAGKGKEELAKATANAIALKNDYLKDNEKAIEAVAEKLAELSEEEIVERLVGTQREVGKTEEEESEPEPEITPTISLPDLPKDDPKISEMVNKEIVKRMKEKYPEMPEEIGSAEYMEWEREIQDSKGARGMKKLLSDFDEVENYVNTDFRKAAYAQTNLENLWVESPSEVLEFIDDDSLPKLKYVNDNFIKINNDLMKDEVARIKKELETLDLTEQDLGVDLTLTEDESGSLTNPTLNGYFYVGDSNEVDYSLINQMGKIRLLKKGSLASKFLNQNYIKLINQVSDRKTQSDGLKREKLKDETLSSVKKSSPGAKQVAEDDVRKITDPAKIAKIMEELESKY